MKDLQRPWAIATMALSLTAGLVALVIAPKQQVYAADAKADSATLVHGKALFTEKCSACHNLPHPEEQSQSRAQWARTVERMRVKYGATDLISPSDAGQIVDYLATFSPKQNGKKTVNDPWSTDAADVWTAAPGVTRVFNFETPNALAELTPVAAGVPGAAPVWHVSADTANADGNIVRVASAHPNASRFGLLVDPRDTPRNADIRVRFRLDGGKISPAVGIAFGFQNPKSYYLLAYKAKTDNLTLLKMTEPIHTALQTTPLEPPQPQTAGLVTTPSSLSGGWHTLRLLLKDGQARGWLDGNKRINIPLTDYTGGKVGLWTQGDTVASFDDWIIDTYDKS